ncbi:hypothetical protein [Pseudodesulfovibrio sp. zrk46]|uniref:hypothetical protein n=1 Tax=Pseudodesulfovibrio sp. zrk46 TaxID=2725288 RepID=UPI001448BBD6|nr:hypothetical protein [Pseudodesulfovibrio sp. zrk46]QJB55632.1 hypothetical protein HFN16_04125 [Pseudodesulfovibrio sp. zrk46]
MSCPYESSDEARQCVVTAVMKKKGEVPPTATLPPIRPGESCEHYRARCRGGLLSLFRRILPKSFFRRSPR